MTKLLIFEIGTRNKLNIHAESLIERNGLSLSFLFENY